MCLAAAFRGSGSLLVSLEAASFSGFGCQDFGGSYFLVGTCQAHRFDDVFGVGGLRQAG
jgi:hypothetical protein